MVDVRKFCVAKRFAELHVRIGLAAGHTVTGMLLFVDVLTF